MTTVWLETACGAFSVSVGMLSVIVESMADPPFFPMQAIIIVATLTIIVAIIPLQKTFFIFIPVSLLIRVQKYKKLLD